jgi:hypothetical protein
MADEQNDGPSALELMQAEDEGIKSMCENPEYGGGNPQYRAETDAALGVLHEAGLWRVARVLALGIVVLQRAIELRKEGETE